MKLLFILSLVLCCVLTFAKGVIHVILDLRNGYKIVFARAKGYVYFLPYDKDVSEKDVALKRICNYLQKIMMISVIIFIIVFLLKFFLRL